jgi:D-alanyl-D-alanine carboxypeptidase
MGRLLVVVVLLLLAVSWSSAAPGSAHTGSQPFPADIVARMRELVEGDMHSLNETGALVSVSMPGKGTWVTAFGVANRDTKQPMTTDLTYRIASNTKSFTCTVLLQLADERKLSLADPVSKYVSGAPNGDAITLLQLCHNTSGLADYTSAIEPKTQADLGKRYTARQVLAIAFALPPDFPPGQGWRYSNSNFVLVGQIVEKVTGKSIGRNIEQRVLRPLGLSHTGYPGLDRSTLPKPHAQGYWVPQAGTAAVNATNTNPSIAGAAGAMYSTLADQRKWVAALGSGKLLSPASSKLQFDGVALTQAGPPWLTYGLGAMNLGPLRGHDGEINGFISAMFYDPGTKATFVVVYNDSTPGGDAALKTAAKLATVVEPDRLPFTMDTFAAAPK